MQRNSGRKLLYSEDRVRQLVANLRADSYASAYETQVELRRLQVEVMELRATLAEMVAARLAVENAQAELAGLYRERAIARARAATRDPALPLQ